ncbi:MAG: tandem-95 repeat protein, partial [Planctomycetes bacterium]|nr:tandem-95 repeat protein [Planctomycetota bacterium]
DAPVFGGGVIPSFDEDTSLVDFDIDLAAFFTDVDGDDLTYSVTIPAGSGTASIVGDLLTYVPTLDTNGIDTFTVEANDGALTASGVVSVTVRAVNDAPVAADIPGAVVNEDDAPITIAVVPSATDVEGDTLTISPAGFPLTLASGAVVDIVANEFVYTTGLDFNGIDTFTYTLDDDGVDNDGLPDPQVSNVATVTVTVAAIDDPLVDNAPHLDESTTEDVAAFVIDLAGYVTDVDGDILTASINVIQTATTDQGAALSVVGSTVLYTPALDDNSVVWTTDDTFAIDISDGVNPPITLSVVVGVSEVNDAPVGVDHVEPNFDEDTSVVIDLTASATDVDDVVGDLTLSIISGPANGTFVQGVGHSWTLTPAPNFNGDDSVTMRVTDPDLETDTFTVSITID